MDTSSPRQESKQCNIQDVDQTRIQSGKYTNESYTIAWICALDIEQAAAQGMLDARHPQLLASKGDTNSYRFGSIGGHNIVIAVLASAGTSPAAIAATNLLRSFPGIRFGLMVGVGGGAPIANSGTDPQKDIRLGDVVVSSPSGQYGGVIQYDLGKSLQDGKFALTGSLNSCPTILKTAVAGLRGDALLDGYQIQSFVDELCTRYPNANFQHPGSMTDALFATDNVHVNGEEDCTKCGIPLRRLQRKNQEAPMVHYGLIGSSNRVLRDSAYRDRLHQELGILCFEMEAAGIMNDFPCLVIRGVCDYCDSHKNKQWQPYAAAAAAAYTKELLLTIAPEHVSEQKVALAMLEKAVADIIPVMQELHGSAKRIEDRAIFHNLPEADRATFDSIDFEDEETDYICLKDTRTDLLQDISEWMSLPHGKTMFWLSGAAGTGKSTISRTVARRFSQSGQLGASFFFKRNRGDRGNASRLFTTIAAQLARYIVSIRSEIAKALERDPHIAEKGLPEQFDKLILQPLSKHRSPPNLQILLVIDALDECEGDIHIRSIVGLLAQTETLTNINLRVFLTSRPELPIQLGFKEISVSSYKDLILQDIQEDITKHDLLKYLEAKFTKICAENPFLSPDWPGAQTLKLLADMACPLFIFAATVCRFVADSLSEPQHQLAIILNNQHDSLDQISNMYVPILQRLTRTQASQRTKWAADFRNIVGCIVITFESISIDALASFVDLDPHLVMKRLNGLHSVLRVPVIKETPITLHHLSFANFLLDDKHKHEHEFWIDSQDFHKYMAKRCLHLLLHSPNLKQDICSLRKPAHLRQDIDPLLITAHLPTDIQYACRYWIRHSIESHTWDIQLEEQALLLFQSRFLFWFEALSLLGRASETIIMLAILADNLPNFTNFTVLLADAKRFVSANAYIVDLAPLQLYSSCIMFAPQQSFVHRNWTAPTWLRNQPQTPAHWDALISTLEGHARVIVATIYLPNSQILASASQDGEIRLWNAMTGNLQQIIKRASNLKTITFSSDEDLLATAHEGGTIRLRDGRTGGLLQIVLGHNERETNVLAFSHDGKYLASGRDDGVVGFWSISSKKLRLLQKIKKKSRGPVRSLIFSQDSKLLISCSGGHLPIKEFCVWIVRSEQLVLHQTITGHQPSIAMLLSGPSKLLITGSQTAIKSWSISSEDLILNLVQTVTRVNDAPRHMGIKGLALSSDAKLLAAGINQSILLFNMTDGLFKLQSTLSIRQSATYGVRQLTFVSNNSQLATGSLDGTIKLWDVNSIGSSTVETISHSNNIERLAFSSDGRLLSSTTTTSLPSYTTLQTIWDVEPGPPVLRYRTSGNFCSTAETMLAPDSNLMVRVHRLENISVLYASSGEVVHEMKRSSSQGTKHINSLACSPNGRFLASSSVIHGSLWQVSNYATEIDIFDTTSWSLLRSLIVRDHKRLEQCYGVATCSSDGKLLGWARDGTDTQVELWDISRGQRLSTIYCAEAIQWLRFQDEPCGLETNLGIFSIQDGNIIVLQQADWGNFTVQSPWLTCDGQKMLWLPYDYRSAFASRKDLIALGSTSNIIYMIGISASELRKEDLL